MTRWFGHESLRATEVTGFCKIWRWRFGVNQLQRLEVASAKVGDASCEPHSETTSPGPGEGDNVVSSADFVPERNEKAESG